MVEPRRSRFGFYQRREIAKVTEFEKEKPKRGLFFSVLRSLFYLGLIASAVYGIFFSGFFGVKKVEIEGVKSVEIADHINRTLLGKNILFLMPKAYLNDLAKKFPILEEASIVRGLPSTVKITIAEKRQVLIWCTDRCFEVDNNGYAYEEIPRPTDRIVISDKAGAKYEQGNKIVTSEFITFFLEAISKIEENGLKVSEVEVSETTFKLAFITSEGWKIILDPTESLSNQIFALKQVLEKNRPDIHEYVDLRVKGLAYIK